MNFGHNRSPQKDQLLQRELKRTAALGTPLALGELGWMSTYIVDAIMVGRLPHSALAISASSLGNTIFYAIIFCVIRGLDGIETLVAQSYGRDTPDSREDCLRTLAQSMWFVLLGTPLVILATLASIPLLTHFGVSAEIVAETKRYLDALVWSTAPLLLYMALRRYLQSINHVLLITISLVTANLVNLVGDWALLYGHLGAHPMGIAGSGWATGIVRLYMVGLLLIGFAFALRRQKLQLHWNLLRPDLQRLRQLTAIGWPSGVQNITDLGFSTWMSVVCARLGTTLLAAHQVVLDLDAFVYMVPMGLSYAAVIRVGQSAGQGSLPGVRRSARASLLLCMGYISIASLLFAGLPRLWAGVYTTDPRVIAAAVPIFMICGLLQLGDAASVIYASALTGLGDTRTPFFVNTIIFWLIGAPLGWYLAFHSSLALTGLWIGRAVAAILTGVILAIAWRTRLQQLEGRRDINIFTALQPLQTLQFK
ncbi:MATE family efflux transporter [Granulicella arctica]|uniref:MATE family efflux transporter n=1 Tax=Granulicella arctica TaxID=940613 RepID=UPI0021E00DDD|nr:MATE family efflux transporter [Granulicella arctica]